MGSVYSFPMGRNVEGRPVEGFILSAAKEGIRHTIDASAKSRQQCAWPEAASLVQSAHLRSGSGAAQSRLKAASH